MPDPRILREIHQLRGSGFSFVGDSIYDLRGEFHGKTVQVKHTAPYRWCLSRVP